MVDFAGWEMPVQFESIVDEHKATRAAAGLFDVSHMGEATVEGPGAERFLNFVLANDVSAMADGRALYSLMCYEHGGVVDDLIVYRKAANSYLLCLNASNTRKDLGWLLDNAGDFDVEIDDVSGQWGLLALQGPKAFDILAHLTDARVKKMPYYSFVEADVASARCLVSRTGYTGEPGVEIFVPWQHAEMLADEILREGESSGLRLAGLGARDSLRLEAGYPLYGHEIGENISPVQANLMWTVKLGKRGDFIGKSALAKELAVGPNKRIVYFKTGSRRIARPGAPVLREGKRVGEVVSGTFSPILNEAIGSALIDASAASAGGLSVDQRGAVAPIELAKPPFVKLSAR